ncbi:MAG TPA: GspH/FimT family pseudopilin, partial [Lamprocystis sp. (in: g-proteobacteria)]|nr:GspH/FimT family pseudopilin [Lamprocystis sp. (in: g-proteobacteria)]
MNAVRAQRQVGFTLIELMFTVGLLSILLAIGIPSFSSLIASTKLTNTTNTLIGHLQYARSEAVKRGRGRVAVGPYDDSTPPEWRSDQSWADGFMVAAVGSASTTDPVVLRLVDGAEFVSFTITKNGTNAPRVFFSPDGSASAVGTWTICDINN